MIAVSRISISQSVYVCQCHFFGPVGIASFFSVSAESQWAIALLVRPTRWSCSTMRTIVITLHVLFALLPLFGLSRGRTTYARARDGTRHFERHLVFSLLIEEESPEQQTE